MRGLRRGGDERVDPAEEPLPLRLPGRIAEPLRREEARHAQRARIAKGEIREARQPGLEAVDDVEPAAGESRRQVGAHADGEADAAAA